MSELKCSSCVEWYDEGVRTPKELPCRHNVCASCVMHFLGEPPAGHVSHEPALPRGRVLRCPVCHAEVRTEGITTNRTLASKITAMIGLEAMLMSDEDFQISSKPKVKASVPQPKPDLKPQGPEPQPGAQGLGWSRPTTTAPALPDFPVPQQGNEHSLGWSLPGVPQPAYMAPVESMPQPAYMAPVESMPQPAYMAPVPPVQNMPPPYGGAPYYPPPGNYYPQ